MHPERRKGTHLYILAATAAQMCVLARYVILARLLGPEQVGLVAILLLIASFWEAFTDVGADRFLVQDREGGSPAALRTVHFVMLIKAGLTSSAILLLAAPLATLSGAPQLEDEIRWLALAPLIAGLTNYDFRVRQRTLEFAPEARLILASELASLTATLIAALLTRDFTAILWGVTARALCMAVLSRIGTTHRYSVGLSRPIARRLWLFGLPLAGNGLLIFFATQGDRLLVSHTLGLTTLGTYSVVLLCAISPTAVLMKVLANTYLPTISSEVAKGPTSPTPSARMLHHLVLLLAVALSGGFTLIAPLVIPRVFGAAFAIDPGLSALIGILVGLRLMKVAPTTLAIAVGCTEIVFKNNVVRQAGLPLGLFGFYLTGNLSGVVLGLIVGELLANLVAIILVSSRANWRVTDNIKDYGLITLFASLLIATAITWTDFNAVLNGILAICTVLAVILIVVFRRDVIKSLWSFLVTSAIRAASER